MDEARDLLRRVVAEIGVSHKFGTKAEERA